MISQNLKVKGLDFKRRGMEGLSPILGREGDILEGKSCFELNTKASDRRRHPVCSPNTPPAAPAPRPQPQHLASPDPLSHHVALSLAAT